MEHLPTPVLTSVAQHWLRWSDADGDRIQRALLSTVDGHRNVIELESVAKAMGLPPCTLVELRERGLLAWETPASFSD